jgi:glutaredoxin
VPRVGWEIKSLSGANEIALAEHLTQANAKMYGSYWCPHCYEQKQLFGKKAWDKVTYVECGEDAIKNPQPEVCKQAGVTGFPTWSIGGKLDPGVKKLAKLAELSGFKGGKEFKYDRLFTR